MVSSNPNFISASQIRAARALLNWSQEDLGAASGLSIATIRKIETGHISPRGNTIDAIYSAFVEHHIEFLGTDGLRLRHPSAVTLEGSDCYSRLQDDIYHVMKNRGEEVLYMNTNEKRINDHDLAGHMRIRGANIRYRILFEEGDNHIIFPLHEHRWMPSKYFRYNMIIIYRHKIAICVYDKGPIEDMNRIHLLTNKPLAEALRGIFDFIWDNCRKPGHSTAPKVYD